MTKKLLVLLFIAVTGAMLAPGVSWTRMRHATTSIPPPAPPPPVQVKTFADNGCVICHARINEPTAVSARYFEWHGSRHRTGGVGCEKCHGGDAATNDSKKAHQGMFAVRDPRNRVHWRNLPETCGACHQNVVRAFTQSRHFQQLKSTGMGPTCTSCHSHMGSTIVREPRETGNLCAFCHTSINGLLAIDMKIPAMAESFMESLNRAEVALAWAESLWREAEARHVDLSLLRPRMESARSLLREARVGWHAFIPGVARAKADEAFAMAIGVKNELEKRLPL
ncbi:MAG: multiheme c-type cytochrome [Blastocatellia bacterium]